MRRELLVKPRIVATEVFAIQLVAPVHRSRSVPLVLSNPPDSGFRGQIGKAVRRHG
jgi:hypothetical protein